MRLRQLRDSKEGCLHDMDSVGFEAELLSPGGGLLLVGDVCAG